MTKIEVEMPSDLTVEEWEKGLKMAKIGAKLVRAKATDDQVIEEFCRQGIPMTEVLSMLCRMAEDLRVKDRYGPYFDTTAKWLDDFFTVVPERQEAA